MKAQVDFIESRFKGKEHPADVIVHEHCGEAGAIGGRSKRDASGTTAARPPSSVWTPSRRHLYKTTRNEDTRCYFCKNKCLRTFIDVKTSVINTDYKPPVKTKVPLEAGSQRLIIATCEKGTVENVEDMRRSRATSTRSRRPIRISWKSPPRPSSACRMRRSSPIRRRSSPITTAQKKRVELMKKRADIRIGMPRVLNMYSMTPLFTGYFASLGLKAGEHGLLRLHHRAAL